MDLRNRYRCELWMPVSVEEALGGFVEWGGSVHISDFYVQCGLKSRESSDYTPSVFPHYLGVRRENHFGVK